MTFTSQPTSSTPDPTRRARPDGPDGPDGPTTMRAIVQDRYGSADVLRLARIARPEPAERRGAAASPRGRSRPRHLAPDDRPAVPDARHRLRLPPPEEPGARPRRRRHGRRGRAGGDPVRGRRRGVRLRAAARSPSTPPPARTSWPASRRTSPSSRPPSCPVSGLIAAARPRRRRPGPGRPAGARHRRVRRRRQLRRAARQGLRRGGHRRVQHQQDSTWSGPSAPTTSSTTPATTSPTAAAATTSSSTSPATRRCPGCAARSPRTGPPSSSAASRAGASPAASAGHLRAPLLSRFVGQRLTMVTAKENGRDLERLTALIEAGQVTPHVDRTYPLHEVPDAMAHLVAGEVRGKVAIRI